MARNSRPNWILRIGGMLLCLTLLSAHLTSGMMARYSTSVSGSDSARVARLVAVATGALLSEDNIVDDLNKKGDSYQYQVAVSNTQDGQTAEVSLKYKLYIELPEDFPPMEILVSGVSKDETNSTATLLVYNANASFSAGTPYTYIHTITIRTTDETRGFYEDMPITIYVKAEQID